MNVRSDIFSGFGESSDRSSGVHQGVDYLTSIGTGVAAADDGFVALKGTSSTWGNYVVLGHKNADGDVVSYTAYMHLSDVSVGPGRAVSAGGAIGRSGDSGNAKGTPEHLHFEIWTSLDAAKRGTGLNHREDPAEHLPKP